MVEEQFVITKGEKWVAGGYKTIKSGYAVERPRSMRLTRASEPSPKPVSPSPTLWQRTPPHRGKAAARHAHLGAEARFPAPHRRVQTIFRTVRGLSIVLEADCTPPTDRRFPPRDQRTIPARAPNVLAPSPDTTDKVPPARPQRNHNPHTATFLHQNCVRWSAMK